MTDYTISMNDLRTKAEMLRQLNAQFRNQVDEMTAIEANLNGMWEGQAREAFHSAFESDRVQMSNFYNAVEVYAQRLELMLEAYIRAENANIQIANERTYR